VESQKRANFYLDQDFALKQWWPSQIGLWAAFGRISKNIDFLGQILTKNSGKTLKISKNHRVSILDSAPEIPFWAAGWPPLL
jgi:hypothetical protein